MKSYIVKLIQTYMDIISLNEDMSNNFDESIRQKQDKLNQNQDNDRILIRIMMNLIQIMILMIY